MSQQQHSSHDARLDAQTAQQIIARAADLQQAHLETVSPDQLEALAVEVGIRPEFVRRALTEGALAPTTTQVVRRRRKRTLEFTPLTARDMAGALLPGFLYALFAALVTMSLRYGDGRRVDMLLAFLQPAILAAYFGWRQPHRRMGALAGFALGFGAVIAVALTDGPWGFPAGIAFIFGPMLAFVGGALATVRKWWDEQRADDSLPIDEAERA